MKKLLFVLILLTVFIGCEKDDICTDANADTPKLVIRFYDITSPETPKAVTDLLIVGDGNTLSYGIESTRDSIAIPLRILENNTTYKLIKDYAVDDNDTPTDTSDDFATGNEDEIIINYENEALYISKACGFKNVFNEASIGLPDDGDKWILSGTVITNKIENSNNAHVHIFH